MAVCYGTVLSPSPLKIQVDQKKILGEAQLILTDSVRDYNVEMSTIEGTGKSLGPHYTGDESGGSGDAAFAAHKLDIDQQRVRGTTDERDAVLQAVYLILNVERYAYPIYDGLSLFRPFPFGNPVPPLSLVLYPLRGPSPVDPARLGSSPLL